MDPLDLWHGCPRQAATNTPETRPYCRRYACFNPIDHAARRAASVSDLLRLITPALLPVPWRSCGLIHCAFSYFNTSTHTHTTWNC